MTTLSAIRYGETFRMGGFTYRARSNARTTEHGVSIPDCDRENPVMHSGWELCSVLEFTDRAVEVLS